MEFYEPSELAVARVAAAIGEPARTRILFCLMDGRARTSTELAIVAGISPSTASVHLHRLQDERLVKVIVQGKHRYYRLAGGSVAAALEGLTVLAGASYQPFVPNTPSRLHAARTCYDHIAGTLGVLLHDRLKGLGWVRACETQHGEQYEVTRGGASGLQALGIDVERTRKLRRRFAFGCLDWSERKPHLGGALAAAILSVALKKRWLLQELDSRALSITPYGRRQLQSRFGLSL
jgi:DNA-binding transcriptional ArsR family regulator